MLLKFSACLLALTVGGFAADDKPNTNGDNGLHTPLQVEQAPSQKDLVALFIEMNQQVIANPEVEQEATSSLQNSMKELGVDYSSVPPGSKFEIIVIHTLSFLQRKYAQEIVDHAWPKIKDFRDNKLPGIIAEGKKTLKEVMHVAKDIKNDVRTVAKKEVVPAVKQAKTVAKEEASNTWRHLKKKWK